MLVQLEGSRSRLVGWHDGRLKVQLAAPPVDGEANEALVGLLSELFQVSKREVWLVRGETSRRKTIWLLKLEMGCPGPC